MKIVDAIRNIGKKEITKRQFIVACVAVTLLGTLVANGITMLIRAVIG